MYKQASILELIEEGERLKQEGIFKSIDHANSVKEGWFEKTFEASLTFIRSHPIAFLFMTENLRAWLIERSLAESPPSDRAWGAVTLRLRREGYIRHHGYSQVLNPKAHRTPATVWQIISKP